ncbi:hypothetical protein BCR35DRAFT_336158 [Leucosporidium creatinivorum]|uniref:Zn(2)-C6 fungal-type domain-containing protein n=1 Tax=Leucosporidium creatinivorum TaxID=106004 RepID=A0A1Y2CKR4_9BASI|nr:hypothetical protein BCR35DRAFT_336158 [Leucosporidium creatinivorum]
MAAVAPNACDQCKRRRIACKWSNSHACITCERRGVQYAGKPAPYPPGHKWRRVAKGTRIEECRRALEEGRLQGTRADSPPLTPPPTPPDLRISLMSPGEMLTRYQLTSALNYHLVLGAFDAADGAKPGTSLARIAHQLQQSGLRASPIVTPPSPSSFSFPGPSRRTLPALAQNGETQELIMACFAAVGARVSQHTALFGDGVPQIGDFEHLGLLRDKPCTLLIERAIRIADESGFFDLSKATLETAQAINLLRHIINVVCPHHSSAVSLIYALHQLRLATLGQQQRSKESEAMKYPIQDIVLADAEAALRLHTTCILSDEDLAAHFRWTPTSSLQCMKQLSELASHPLEASEYDPEKVYDLVLAVFVLLGRSLVDLRSQGQSRSPIYLQSAFLDLADTCEQLLDVHSARIAQAKQQDPEVAEWWLSLIEGQAREALTFAASACEALQHLGKSWSGMEHEDVKRRWEELFLGALKRLLGTPAFTDSAELYDSASFMACIDPDFDWPQLVVEAALPFSRHISSSLGYSDLCRLQEGLQRFGKIHGAVENQFVRLEACMRAADWGSASPPPQSSPKPKSESDEEANVAEESSA